MQRVSALLPSWDRRKSAGKASLDKVFSWSERPSSAALQRLSITQSPVKVAREAFWPASLDDECDRAARILKSFCTDGYLVANSSAEGDAASDAQPKPASPNGAVKKIPQRIIQNAAGIAIFTCMRSGLWMTGSGGSGILIARKADGTWSPPSGIMLHTPTLSFIIGVDVYDCVLIVNDLAALETLMRPRVTLGEDVGLTAGPLVQLGSTEVDVRWNQLGNTVLTYLKARGQAQDVNLNGCILTERANENERFYTGNLSSLDILAGNVTKTVDETRPLFEVIKAAEGRTDFDPTVIERISAQPAPGDALIETPRANSPASPKPAFGIPSSDDPDPFGVLALEMAGLEIREAGSRLRPSSNQFEFSPSPTSPVFSRFARQSVDTHTSHSNRGSVLSTRTERTKVSEAYTQTQTSVPNTPETTPSLNHGEEGRDSLDRFGLATEAEDEIDYTKVDLTPLKQLRMTRPFEEAETTDPAVGTEGPVAVPQSDKHEKAVLPDKTPRPTTPEAQIIDDQDEFADDADDEDDEFDEEPVVVYEVAAAVQPARTAIVTSQIIQAKGALVTIPKRVAPPLPLRSPARASRNKGDFGDLAKSPLRHSFNDAFESEDVASARVSVAMSEPTHPTIVVEDAHYAHAAAKSPEPGESSSQTSQGSLVDEGETPDNSVPATPTVASPHHRSASAVFVGAKPEEESTEEAFKEAHEWPEMQVEGAANSIAVA